MDPDNQIKEENSSQDRFLDFVYGHFPTRILMKLASFPIFSKIGGVLFSSRLSSLWIQAFVRKNRIDLSEYEKASYRSFNDFFTRRIRKELRPFSSSDTICFPSDGKVSAYPITDGLVFKIKNTVYSLASFLNDDEKAAEYEGGNVLVIRLSPDNYHRYCFPVTGIISSQYRIKGRLHTVNPVIHDYAAVYKENTREISEIRTVSWGNILMAEVGAMMVGKIVNHPILAFQKGDEKGYFSFGGSTIVLVLPKNITVSKRFFENTEAGYETVILQGMEIN